MAVGFVISLLENIRMSKVDLLVIDDDDVNNLILSKILKAAGVKKTTEFYTSAREALIFLEGLSLADFPTYILIDLDMPVLDGFGFLEAFQSRFIPQKADTEVIVLTTSVMDRDRRRAESFECVSSFLVKPIYLEDIRKLF